MKNLSEAEKEEADEYIRKLVRILNNKEKYNPYNRDDFDYYRIRTKQFWVLVQLQPLHLQINFQVTRWV